MASVSTTEPAAGREGHDTGRRRAAVNGLAVIERRLGLTPLGVGFVLGAIAVWVIGRALTNRGLDLLAYGLVLVLALSWTLGRRRLGIEAQRSQLPSRAPARRQVEAGITLTATRRVGAIVAEEQLHPHLGPSARFAIPVLPSGESVEHTYTFTPTVRGVYEVGPLVVEFSDPFGLTRRRQPVAEAQTIIIHPRVEPIIDRIVAREWEDPPMRPPLSRPWPSGFEFYGMRDYVEGDDSRRIVWRALAQHDRYLVRDAEQGITDRVKVYIDSDRDSHQRGRPSPTFETAVGVAASLATKHIRDGFSVNVDINSGRVVANARGEGRRIPMMDALAAVSLEPAPLTDALDRIFVDPQRNAHNIVITPTLTQDAAARLRVLLERGNSLVVVLVLSDDTEPMTIHRAGGLRCHVVEVPPGVALATVSARGVSLSR